MDQLTNFFNIPSYYNDLNLDIYSENLLPLFKGNPIEYMRKLYSTNSRKFYNTRDELILRGIGFQPQYQNNYLLDRTYKIKHILYKNENTNAFEQIDFSLIGTSNFIERFDVSSDLFFNNIPLEGILHFTQGASTLFLENVFKEAGFLITPIQKYNASTINQIEDPYVTLEPKVIIDQAHESDEEYEELKVEYTDMTDATIDYFFDDAIFLTFRRYCSEHNIQNFSDLTLDFISNYEYQKHVRRNTAIKVLDLYNEINLKYYSLQVNFDEALYVLQNNKFKQLMENVNQDYLEFIDEFYAASDMNIHKNTFPFEKVEQINHHIINTVKELAVQKNQEEFDEVIRNIGDHPKFKYILSLTFAEIKEMLDLDWSDTLDLGLYLFDVLDDIGYKPLFKDLLKELNYMSDISETLGKVANALKPRELEVIQLRRTKTLQEVGERLEVTRERVRQIESKATRRLPSFKKQLNLKMYFQYCTEHSKILKIKEFMQALGLESYLDETLLILFFEMEESITYIESIDRYIGTNVYNSIMHNFNRIDFTKAIIEVNEIKELFNNEIGEESIEIVDLLIKAHNYKRVDAIYVKENVNIIARINHLFKHFIKEPLEMDDEGYIYFKELMEETFEIPFDSGRRAAATRVADAENVILVDRNTYCYHNAEVITDQFLVELERIMDEQLNYNEYVDPRWLYKENITLMLEFGLSSHVHLYSIVQNYLGEKYETGNGNTLYIYKSNADRLDAESILLHYLIANGHAVPKANVLLDLKWKEHKLDQLLPRIKSAVLVGNGIVKTIESFNFREEELAELQSNVEVSLEKGYVFTYDLQFELAFNEKLSPLIERCKLADDVTLTAILKWLNPNLQGYSKMLYWNKSDITKIEQVIALEFPEIVARQEMIEFIASKGYSDQTIYKLPTEIVQEGLFYNYSNIRYINANIVNFTDEVKDSLASYLEEQFEDKQYRSVFTMVGYSQKVLPISSYEWTEWLIYHFAERVGYRKIQVHNDYRYDKLVLVKEEVPIYNYEQLVLHILKTDYRGRYHEEDLASYLEMKKITHNPRRLTNEIYNSQYFKFDSFGFFEVRGVDDVIN